MPKTPGFRASAVERRMAGASVPVLALPFHAGARGPAPGEPFPSGEGARPRNGN